MTSNYREFKYQDEAQCVETLLRHLSWDNAHAVKVSEVTQTLITDARNSKVSSGEVESFLREYGLETKEGLALMTLAEALLRIPDANTANALIHDKISQADWSRAKSDDWLLRATSLGLNLTKKTLNSLVSKLGEPVIRQAVGQAMKMMGRQFVLGRTIEEAMSNCGDVAKQGYRMSYDMLGEGARTYDDAARYFDSYKQALLALTDSPQELGTGLSVKLSALHPRYEFSQKDVCVPSLVKQLKELCQIASSAKLRITIDAEEADRLDLSYEILCTLMDDPEIKSWSQDMYGLGLAVQAYQKRAYPFLEAVLKQGKSAKCPLHVRLVKGAYWDSEIKHAQVFGLPDYTVFTRKGNTDLSYLVCAQLLLAHRGDVYPMFGTHNAQTVASILECADGSYNDFEFQRLHGMGETLYACTLKTYDVNVSLYAPVGRHESLLAYLVRRLLENGANSSFVHKIYDTDIPAESLATDYVTDVRSHETKRHPSIPLPCDIYGVRLNSTGIDLTDSDVTSSILASLKAPTLSPCQDTSNVQVDMAFDVAKKAWESWRFTSAEYRGKILLDLADLLEENSSNLMSLCVYEAEKTIPDAHGEIREAVDFCRYYAMQGMKDFHESGVIMPSPTGETNTLTLEGRGVFVCISPWNFPLAIFLGQVSAALMAGNCVIAKPAEQTPYIAKKAVELCYQAGVPKEVLHLLLGGGDVGASIVAHSDVSGVVFTGSTHVARLINRTLAAKDSAIVPLIAETGGQNAMIVDSTALPEQVADDVIVSAFGSAGQRCSALRVLCVQDDVADIMIEMIKGAMDTLVVGNSCELSTDIGPVIDADAKDHLHREISRIDGHEVKTVSFNKNLKGCFVAPTFYEITSLDILKDEVFGPVLHVYRYKSSERDQLIDDINALGFGLTFGLHSRIDGDVAKDARSIQAGNIYINRSTIGAVVGVQPFGGRGLSGTGPKAGGPYYLHRFATEKTVTINTTATGGNASLIALEE